MKLTKRQKDFIFALDFTNLHNEGLAYLIGVLLVQVRLNGNKDIDEKIRRIIKNSN